MPKENIRFLKVFFTIIAIQFCIVNTALVALAIYAFYTYFWFMSQEGSDKRLLRIISAIKDGDFQVIDCYSTELEVFIGGDGTSHAGIVHLETVDGQACCDKFIISTKDAYANKDRKVYHLYLLCRRSLTIMKH